MMNSRNNIAICLMAAFQPQPSQTEIRSVARTSSSLKSAIARMDTEASELREVATSTRRPFRETLHDIVERLIS